MPIDRAMADQLDEALNELDDDLELWAGVLTGTREMFSAGSDLTSGGDYVTERGGEYGIIRRQRRKPLIAAVEGFALGGGLEIVLSCDMVVASTEARFGLPEVSIGVIPTCAGLFRGPRALPRNVARQLILTGRPLDAAARLRARAGQPAQPTRAGGGTGARAGPGDLHQRARLGAGLPGRAQRAGGRGRRPRLGGDDRGDGAP